MTNYSILRIGNEYVVQADDKSILKCASRRKAARLISDAADLMDRPAIQASPEQCDDPSIIPDQPEVP